MTEKINTPETESEDRAETQTIDQEQASESIASSESGSDESSRSEVHQWVLHVLSGMHAGAEAELVVGDMLIGRDEGCDIVLADASVAQQHAVVHHQDGACHLEPAEGATLYLDGVLVEDSTPLQQGQIITLGQIHLAFGTIDTAWDALSLPHRDEELAQEMQAHAEHAGKKHGDDDQHSSPETASDKTPQQGREQPQAEHVVAAAAMKKPTRKKQRGGRLAMMVIPSGFFVASVVTALWFFHDMPSPMDRMPEMSIDAMMSYSIFSRQGVSEDVLARHASDDIIPAVPPMSLKERITRLLAQHDEYRGRFVLRDGGQRGQSSESIIIDGYVRSHSSLSELKRFVASQLNDTAGRVRYRVTTTATLGMALRAELESRGFHNIGIRDNGDGSFILQGLVKETQRLRRVLREMLTTMPRLKALQDQISTFDEATRYLQGQLDEQNLSLRVQQRENEDKTTIIEVRGLVNENNYKKWQQIAADVTHMYKPWLYLDDQVVNVRGFSLSVLSAVRGPHSFITVLDPQRGQIRDYVVDALLPNGFRLKEVATDHLVLMWQGREYTYVLGDERDDRRTTDIRP